MKYLALVVLILVVCAPAMAHDDRDAHPYRGGFDYRSYDDRDCNRSRSHTGLVVGAIVGGLIGAYIDSRRDDRRPQYRQPHCEQSGPVEYDPTWGHNPVRR